MLQLRKIFKKYTTGDLVQTALDSVDLSLRDNEFVAVLGPSGSGKTTLLNVIGGLDRYDSGDMLINGVSTKEYRERDWDAYRNHTIGFVFQSYNLISHQSVAANVELALTISGVSRAERRRRAKEDLERVGLGDQLHKKPNQLSGGQMQRVAIARALINDPDILLADEPTGALDTETSVQVMELLKEVARDRLVVMVTHNPELAEQYATRIVRLRDGRITDDTDPYEPEAYEQKQEKHAGKSSMSFLTAISLSFNNLRTKKGRTLLTSFASSIGIIGIALILSLSSGVNTYIADIQKSTMTSYPITIEQQAIDLSSLMEGRRKAGTDQSADHALDGVYSDGRTLEMASSLTTSISENNLTQFRKYLDDPASEINEYVGEGGVVYSYDMRFGVYTYSSDGEFINTDGSGFKTSGQMSGFAGMSGMQGMSMMGFSSSANRNFEELLPASDGGISPALTDGYDLLYGSWPVSREEVVLALDKNNEIPAATLYELGVLPAEEYRELMKRIDNGEAISVETQKLSYDELCSQELYLIPACDTYVEQENGIFKLVGDDDKKLEELLDSAVKLRIVGVVRQTDDVTVTIDSAIGYTKALTDYLMQHTSESAVVKAQQADNSINVLNGLSFAPKDDSARIADTRKYIENLGVTEKAKMCSDLLMASAAGTPQAAQMASMDESSLAAMFDSYIVKAEDDVLLKIYDGYISPGDYDDNMQAFGFVSADAPSSISIYVDSFEAKDMISSCITKYNSTASEADKITYTDAVGLLMSSVTTIVDVISYVLIAFVAVSLVVSSIMVGIITYISVLERTKEIGILRAIGASRHNVSQVFNAETFIIGLCAGIIGIGITLLILIPGNAVIHALVGSQDINAALPPLAAVILILLSMVLTLVGGLIPSGKAARKDPVTALRSE